MILLLSQTGSDAALFGVIVGAMLAIVQIGDRLWGKTRRPIIKCGFEGKVVECNYDPAVMDSTRNRVQGLERQVTKLCIRWEEAMKRDEVIGKERLRRDDDHHDQIIKLLEKIADK